MRDDVGRGEVAARAEPALKLRHEVEVDVHLRSTGQ
jgi:hypothetical protein